MIAAQWIVARWSDGEVSLTGWGFFLLAVLACLAAANVTVRR